MYKKIKPNIKMKDITGRKYGSLTALYPVRGDKSEDVKWMFKCDCGNEKIINHWNVIKGRIVSCGCYRDSVMKSKEFADKHKIHGMYKHPAYVSWTCLKSRCSRINDKNYGGRGITYCNRWEDFENFWEDMKDGWKSGLTLDRIDNNGDYTKENCRWATYKEQNNNNRNCRNITVDSVTKNVKQWANHLDVGRRGIYRRFSKGYSDVQAIKYFIKLRGKE